MESYIWYLQNVLGVKSVLIPDGNFDTDLLQESAGISHPILVIDANPWSGAAEELFLKMLTAMKLQKADIQIVFIDQVSANELATRALASRYVICFADKIAEDFGIEEKDFTKTISPAILLKKPELKRQAWEDLKKVMENLNHN